MLPEYFALIGVGIASLGGFYYLYCTLRGTVRPHKMTYFFFGLFSLIAFASQLSQGVGMIAWATFIAGLTPFIILVAASFNSNAYWQIKRTDYLYGIIAVLAMVIWYITNEPNIALALALIADFFVAIPTLIKTYQYPKTESWQAYGINAVGFGVGIFSIHTWTFENYAFLVYLFVVNVSITALALALRNESPVAQ
ncbi:hypothetical protein A2592_02490 [Candidatus Kaiserbacteria bacterium RIFOXYD1_FULL_42_15]|uniref:Uncharacterized protein n=1 Tax=Candidatus Kaiserbacteria bacterium RIFOXYD1_FULL_42_15 TaxID=1798532 RepID=A0A1F6FPP9_9BACT|nr:MAG: hypothetical protein A2592_02490 [Candidatus Kaiserbacteria bacterium RIFOXYD1_FULL_42_15]